MKDKKSIKYLASQVIKSEKALARKENVKQNWKKIDQIVSTLSLPEILELNDYVLAFFRVDKSKNL